jgi:hypothetical protein
VYPDGSPVTQLALAPVPVGGGAFGPIALRLAMESERRVRRTDEQGRLSFEALRPGRYGLEFDELELVRALRQSGLGLFETPRDGSM